MSKYNSIDLPEKESFYLSWKLVDLEHEFDKISELGYLIVWSQENIDNIYSFSKMSQRERSYAFEKYIITQIRVAHGIFL